MLFMSKKYKNNKVNESVNEIHLEDFYNKDTLNIFSDASIYRTFGCYGSIAVCRDLEYERSLFTKENTTVNECELLGIRLSLLMAIKYQNNFRIINIFSDSLISVNTINNYKSHYYKYDNDLERYQICRYIQNKLVPFKNQQILIDCIWLFNELLSNPNIRVNLFHQSGHIIPNRFNGINDINMYSVEKAKKIFTEVNKVYSGYTPSTELIIYISKYNDAVDRSTRIALQEMTQRTYQQYFTTPIHFRPLCYTDPTLLDKRRE